MPGRSYSRAERKILRRRYTAGDSAEDIGEELGRTARSVYHEAAKLKLKHGSKYTRAEKRQIRSMHAEGESPEAIAAALKRPLEGLKRKMCEMKLYSGHRYSKREERTIRALKRAGRTAPQIAAALPGRDVDSVRDKLSRMGLGDKKAKKHQAARKARAMTNDQHRIFCDFLRQWTQGEQPLPVLELVLLWNTRVRRDMPEVTRDKVEYWLGKLRLPCISGKEVKQKSAPAHRRRMRLKLETLHTTLSKQDEEELKKLRELRTTLLRRRKDRPKTAYCPRCPKEEGRWPITPDFFYHKRSGGGEPQPDLAMCILCTKRHRRARTALKARGATDAEIRDWQKRLAKAAQQRRRELRNGPCAE